MTRFVGTAKSPESFVNIVGNGVMGMEEVGVEIASSGKGTTGPAATTFD